MFSQLLYDIFLYLATFTHNYFRHQNCRQFGLTHQNALCSLRCCASARSTRLIDDWIRIKLWLEKLSHHPTMCLLRHVCVSLFCISIGLLLLFTVIVYIKYKKNRLPLHDFMGHQKSAVMLLDWSLFILLHARQTGAFSINNAGQDRTMPWNIIMTPKTSQWLTCLSPK